MPVSFTHNSDLGASRVSPDTMMTTEELSRYLKTELDIHISPLTLATWRHRADKAYIPFRKPTGGKVYYQLRDALDFLASRAQPMTCSKKQTTQQAA